MDSQMPSPAPHTAQATTPATIADWGSTSYSGIHRENGGAENGELQDRTVADSHGRRQLAISRPQLLLRTGALSAAIWLGFVLLEDLVAFGVWIAMAVALSLLEQYVSHQRGPNRKPESDSGNLGPYRLRIRIGSGGMGDVFLAEHTLLRRRCAIKIIRADRVEDPVNRTRFEREVRWAAQMCHPNIVTIYDGGRLANGTFYYAMEYLDGVDLQELVEQYGALPGSRVIRLMQQLCAALRHAHGMHLVHRDLKPANIFVTHRDGVEVAKILDFGLVRRLDEDSSLTVDGLITGSPLYLSPEQATGESPADERSDIYSLGAVMYFLLTERPPFCDEQTVQLLLAHANRPPKAVSELNGEVSLELEALVMQCLAKNPADRFGSARELLEALLDCPEWTPDLAG
jgi:eukaryotic-like serine/threonine-protein kinase